MAKDKALGPDAFPPNFFQANWDLVGDDIVKMVQHFFLSGHILKEMNSTFISQIPKIESPTSLSHFRPISLCNTTYKIISKLLDQRMKPFPNKIISPYQSAFIPGRQISDNIVIAHELIHSMRSKRGVKGDKGSMGIKIDMVKDFDRNLSRTLIHSEDLGIISGIKICKGAPSINHLLFADDCMVFCKANKIEAQNLMDILNLFGDTSGQLIDFNKSGVFFSRNTDPSLIPAISNIMGVKVLQLDDKYLGSPLFTHLSKIKSFRPRVDKMKLRLSSWKNVPLNPAGREILIKTVTPKTSIFQMNCFRIPKQTFQDLNKLQRYFFWGKNLENPTGYYPKAWTAIYKPKELSGLGFINMELFNRSMIIEIGWRLEQDKDSLWYQLMDSKYLMGGNILNMDTKAKYGNSWIWKGILQGIQNIQQYCSWKIGKGNRIKIWEDLWIPNSTEKLIKPAHCLQHIEMLKHLMTPSGKWNAQLVQQIFSINTAQIILSQEIHPGADDTMSWNLNNTGKFSVKATQDKDR
ncbi:uncharacterized protein LOC113273187 [Papaver somniferum]|uniref:uncharacterized protein LOC113273187 n=1 Tax=Papaver somniferum TaxID=3469 RepID=UPI000E6F5B84|nr:uncharacterized protein LOC113273187 [Papaver somniferum]